MLMMHRGRLISITSEVWQIVAEIHNDSAHPQWVDVLPERPKLLIHYNPYSQVE